MFGSQKLSSSIDNRKRIEWQGTQNSFLREWEKRINKSDTKTTKSVEDFAKNLWPHLTNQLTNIFDKYKQNPNYSWLTDSDIWLDSLGELYRNNQDKMPWQLEWYLKGMMELLIEYKEEHKTIDGIATTLKSATSAEELSEISSSLSRENLPPFNSKIRPAEGIEPLNV